LAPHRRLAISPARLQWFGKSEPEADRKKAHSEVRDVLWRGGRVDTADSRQCCLRCLPAIGFGRSIPAWHTTGGWWLPGVPPGGDVPGGYLRLGPRVEGYRCRIVSLPRHLVLPLLAQRHSRLLQRGR